MRFFKALRHLCPDTRMRGGVNLAVAFSGLILVLAGCGSQTLKDSELVFATRAVTVDSGRAFVLLPAGNPVVVGVTQRNYDNAIAQTISLMTSGRVPGENRVEVAFLTSADVPEDVAVEGRLLPSPSIEDVAIIREMEESLPGVAMQFSLAYVQNRYGPFGYAFGRSTSGDGCLYAWQRIARDDSLLRPKSGLVSVRIRICEPSASETSLLRLVYGYSINASLKRAGWGPVGDAPAPPPGLGEAGAPIYPKAPAARPDEANASTPAVTPRSARRVRTERPRQDDPASRPEQPLEGYPTVPPPPNSSP